MSKPVYVQEGEILPPLAQGKEVAQRTSNEDLNYLASWLDDRFELPGTGIRFGLDALIGWIPGLGDAFAALASMFIVFAAWKRGAARITVVRMLLNLTLEATLGAIPIIGDFAHVLWKANRRNYNLLIRDQQSVHRHMWQDWLFVSVACLVASLLLLGPFVLLVYLIKIYRPLY